MVGPFRRSVVSLALLAASARLASGQDAPPKPEPPAPSPPAPPQPKLAPADFGLPGEDPPRAFVPAQPRSVEERKRVEALRSYAAARALEETGHFADAIKALEQALAGDPDSVAVLRRLVRVGFAMGREGSAVTYGRRVLAAEPGDMETMGLLMAHFKDEPAVAEAILREAAANPKLDKSSAGALNIQFELGNIFEATRRIDLAAASFAKVVAALDDKSKVRLTMAEARRFLAPDEAQAYLRFGRVFLQARKLDDALNAFRRGLVYDPDEPLLLLYLAQSCQEANRFDEALGAVEKFLRRQPSGRQPYDLLVKILVALKREDEIIPRLEKYAAADPKNAPLQYALADRYKAAGLVEKAQAIYRVFLAEQRETQDFAETFPRLVKERKTEELLTLLVRAATRLKRIDPVKPQIEELIKDPAYTDEVIEAGIRMISSRPPALEPQEGWIILANIARDGDRPEKLAKLWRWSVDRMPSPQTYRELVFALAELRKDADAVAALRELFARFPDERNARNLVLLAKLLGRTDKLDEATATVREALAVEPNEPDAVRTLALFLGQAGKADEAVAAVRDALKLDAANPELNGLLASFLIQAGKLDDAIAYYKGLLERFPNNDELVKVARSGLSNVYTSQGDFAKGEAELEILFAKDPDDPGINNDLGYLYADQGKNLEKAEGMIRKALAEDPTNFAYLDSLGWVLFKRGKVEEARGYLEKAQDDSRVDATIPDHLGDVYFQLQQVGKAKAMWERALKMAADSKPPDKRLPEIRKKLQSVEKFEATPRPAKGDNP